MAQVGYINYMFLFFSPCNILVSARFKVSKIRQRRYAVQLRGSVPSVAVSGRQEAQNGALFVRRTEERYVRKESKT